MATAPKKKPRAGSDLIPTRTSRLHNKSSVAVGAATAKRFSVTVTVHKPEQFAAVILSEDDHSLVVRRKKGYGSSKLIETMINKSDVLEITGEGVGSQAIIRAFGMVPEVKLPHQKVKRQGDWIICTDSETGEVTRLNSTAKGVVISVVGEDEKGTGAGKAPASGKSNVARLPARAGGKKRDV